MYARRLQIQENMSRQIAEAVQPSAPGVAVVIQAQHMCAGDAAAWKKQNSSMVTSVMLGEFRDNAATRSGTQPDPLRPGPLAKEPAPLGRFCVSLRRSAKRFIDATTNRPRSCP